MSACPEAFATEVNPALKLDVVMALVVGVGAVSVTTEVVDTVTAVLSPEERYVTPSPIA